MTARQAAAVVWVVSVALCIAGAVFAVWSHDYPGAVGALLGTVVPTAGAVVARHVPRNPVGWSQLAAGVLGSVATVGLEYGPIALAHGWTPGLTHLLMWIAGWAWLPALATALVFTALWFPDGRLVGRGFRPVLAVAITANVVWVVAVGVVTWDVPTRQMVDDTAPDPTGPLATASLGSLLVLLIVAVLALASLVVRWRRAERLGRQQLKWMGLGLSTVVAFVVATELVDLGAWQNTLGTLSLEAVAVAIGIGVLRYRLYEIDRIVSRTLAYSVVVAALGAVYAAIVLGLQALLPDSFGSFGVALATLAVSVLFLPLTRRVRRAVDHRFNRRRFDSERLVARFAERTRNDVSHETMQTELLRTVTATVQPTHATLWVARR